MPETTRLESEIKLSIATRLNRLRAFIIETGNFKPKDVALILDELDQIEEQVRHLQAALSVARYALKPAMKQIDKLRTTIKVLRPPK